MADLVLFGTEGCHLCEDAEGLLLRTGLSFEKQDIMAGEQWQQRYAIRIPVLLHPPSGSELGWPFDEEGIRDFLVQTGIKFGSEISR
ncbi:MAG: glutaredoxin family protein [Methylomonas sp.]|nr:glutaredoxin family protein [Methylomonas sp.]